MATTQHTHTAQLAQIPADLRALPQWVLWASEQRDGKATKVPRRVSQPTQRASSTDPTSWGTFEAAVAALGAPGIEGLGFVFTAGDPFCGVDLDACMTPAGELVPEALAVVEALDSYTELSPSGSGVHVIVRAQLPQGAASRRTGAWGGHLERYDRGRYFTFTGRQLEGSPGEIAERQLEVEQLLPEPTLGVAPAAAAAAGGFSGEDRELLERARDARNGDLFAQLYDRGDPAGVGDESHSSADLALCNLLAFWTGCDAGRMDSLFRSSALMREKWDAPARAGETYGEGTIRTAIAGCSSTYGDSSPAVAAGPQPVRELVEGPDPGTQPRALDEVLEVFRRWLLLPDDPAGVLVPLAVAQANRMAGDPVWLLDIRPPGWGKTEGIAPIAGALREAHMVSTLTEASLLSGTSRKERQRDSTGGLLRTVGEYGILVLKDFTSILSMHREQRASTIAALREVYDGSWVRNVGTDGGRTLEWQGKVGVIAGCTEAYDRHHGVIGAMGDRFLIHRAPTPDPEAVAQRALEVAGHEGQMRAELTAAVAGLFAGLPWGDAPELLEEGSPERQQLVDVALIATQARSTVERDDYSREIENVHGAEAPTRLLKALMLLRAALIVIGLSPEEAHKLTARVALDSIPQHRRRLLSNLAVLGPDYRIITKDAAMDLGLPVRTTERVLEDLAAQGMIVHTAGSQGRGNAATWHIAAGWHERWRRAVPSGL